ncbi:MAG: hypothetical protein Q9218_003220, partial [Villophora microphyllina]
ALKAVYDCVDKVGLSDYDILRRARYITTFTRKIIETLKKSKVETKIVKAEATKVTKELKLDINNNTSTSRPTRNPKSSRKDRAPS